MTPPEFEHEPDHFDLFGWRDEHCLVDDVRRDRWDVINKPAQDLFQWGFDARKRVAQNARGTNAVALEVTFENLADEWESETVFESVTTRKALHPAYQRVIGLGPAAVPLILRRLQREPAQWFWALTAITGENPAAGTDSLDDATAAWLEWGSSRRL